MLFTHFFSFTYLFNIVFIYNELLFFNHISLYNKSFKLSYKHLKNKNIDLFGLKYRFQLTPSLDGLNSIKTIC